MSSIPIAAPNDLSANSDTLFRTGNAIHGHDGIHGRESPHSTPRISFEIDGRSVIYGRFDDGRIAEVLMEGANATAARLVTLLLQRGVEIEPVRKSINDGDVIAAVLDRLMAMNGGPRTAAYRWLLKVPRRKTVNRRRTTYSFKRWAEEDEGQYTTVEEFNAAAIALDFRLEPIAGTPNYWINIAEPRKSKRSYQ
jgi:hypothetical protein